MKWSSALITFVYLRKLYQKLACAKDLTLGEEREGTKTYAIQVIRHLRVW